MAGIRYTAKERPKWYQFRWRLSSAIVRFAQWIYPDNPDLKAYMAQAMSDMLIYGHHISRVNPADVFPEPTEKQLKAHDKRFKNIIKKARKD